MARYGKAAGKSVKSAMHREKRGTLRSGKAQKVLLELPSEISGITVEGKGAKVAKGTSPNQRKLTLPATAEVTVKISCKR